MWQKRAADQVEVEVEVEVGDDLPTLQDGQLGGEEEEEGGVGKQAL